MWMNSYDKIWPKRNKVILGYTNCICTKYYQDWPCCINLGFVCRINTLDMLSSVLVFIVQEGGNKKEQIQRRKQEYLMAEKNI